MGSLEDYTKMSKDDLKSSLDDRHLLIIEQVAQSFNLTTEIVTDSILAPEQIYIFDRFCVAEGSPYVLFYHQTDQASSSSRPISGLRALTLNKNIIVTDGREKRLTGKCVYFLRNPKKALDKRTLSKSVSMGMFESEQNGIVSNLEQLVQSIFLPALKRRPDNGWGRAESDKIVNFLESLDRFTGVLQQARESINVSVRLRKPDTINSEDFKTPADYVEAAKSSELVDSLEELVGEWCKQIEQVLAESSQMRKEADDIGPKAELEHWKNRMAKFNALTDQIKSKELQVVVSIMHIAKSRLLKQWQQLDNRITDSANEAKDNVKYLYTLDRLCEPLYKCTPVELVDAIPGLLSAIKMIYSISRYYNTSERMTSLFVKITNQMITSCKSYIYQGNPQIWDHERAPLVLRLEHCMKLNDAYQRSFNRIKAELAEDPAARQFDFSEMYIFGKFDTFCKRSQRVISMLNVMSNFSMLETAQIEGIEVITKQFGSVVSSIKRKKYDVLDHRKMEFDGDYEEFQRAMDKLMEKLQRFMDGAFDTVMSLERSLVLLEKFAFLESFNLDVMDKYNRLVVQFGKEMENVSKMYDKCKQHPPIQRNLPPVAGAVQWARQLYRRIEYPMSVFLKRPAVLKSKEGKKIVRKYNKLARVLFEFEALYHKGWVKSVELAKSGLQASLLVRNPQTNEIHVNFDPEVLQVIRETKCLRQVGLEIPDSAKLLCLEEKRIKQTFNELSHLVQEYTRIKQSVPKIFQALCAPMLNKIDQAVEPGLLKLTWTSLNIDAYIKTVANVLADFEQVMRTVADIRECRITTSLTTVENTCLSAVPSEEPWDIALFLQETEGACSTYTDILIRHNQLVEKATRDLIQVFKDSMTPEEAVDLQDKFSDVVNYFSMRTIDSFTKCTRMSLDTIKRRLSTTADKYGGTTAVSTSTGLPFFLASIKLVIPNIVVYPAIEDIQQCLNSATSTILGVMKHMQTWNPALEGPSKKNYFTEISSNKDIVKILMMFNSAITSMKVGISPILGEFVHFKDVWETDENTKVDEFLATEPTGEQIEDEIVRCEEIEVSIGSIIGSYGVGSVQLCTDDLKMALGQMTKSYKIGLGRELQQIAKAKMDDVMTFVADKQKRLARNVTNLEDIRLVMDALMDTREDEIRIEMLMGPIEDSYQTLNRLDIQVSKEETEGVDTLRYEWNKLTAQVNEVQDHLIEVQAKYREDLITTISEFQSTLTDFETDYRKNGPKPRSTDDDVPDPSLDPADAIERLSVFQRRFNDVQRKYETCSAGEALFGLPVSTYDAMDTTRKELKSLSSLYGLYKQVLDSRQSFNEMLWCEVDIEKNSQLLADFQTKCRKLPKSAKEMKESNQLKKLIDDMAETMPILELMSNKAMLPRHWRQIEQIVDAKFDVEKTDTFTLRDLMDAPILEHSEDVEDICVAATKEKDIDEKLTGIIADWSCVDLGFTSFKGKEDMLLNGGATQEVVALMEDSLMALSSLLSNRYNTPFKANIQEWVQKLSKSSEIIDLWLVVQNLYAYLEAVFVGGDIAKDLPQEAKRFQQIDKQWVKLMSRAVEIANVVEVCTSDDTADQILTYLREQLELCQKSLSGYLETKRGLFPRFYFVSDPTLLEILGQASDSHNIQPHLCNVFDNCNTLDFASNDKSSRDYNKIVGMNTRCGEHVDLSHPVIAEGVVEDWLDKLLTEMRVSINDVCREASQAVWRMELREFQDHYPAQIGLVGLQLKWTTESEEALAQARTDKKIMATCNKGHLDILNELIEITTTELSKMDRKLFETLVTTMVHNRDVFDVLVQNHVRVLSDFEWLKQSRTYWKEDIDTSIVSITDVDFEYQCEMLGIQERLCITPLTDRCYITLAQCMGMSLGGAPAGPAGTGKTETVKDMGRCLGKMVVVFNCSDQMDYRGLGRIFKGMTKSGSWVDFDEFNRIKLPVLSVAAGQIAVCLNSRRERKDQFIFTDGDVCSMNKEMGVFITMNPGYAGRQELPENLKVQFRTVAMMVPDRQIIMRVKLASVGFKQNVMLAKKFFMLYKLCEQQLSKQTHYDFGLRNILSVLRTLGAVKRGSPEMTEQLIVMSVLRDMNIAKLIDEDEPLFMSLIDDLFPGMTVAAQQYPDLEEAIKGHLVDMKLVWHDPWILKVIQLFETQRVRHGIAVLGPSGAGKTQAINIMMKSLTTMGVPHKDMRMNPKAITAEEMFGKLDVTTNDWTDGIFSTLWRRTHKTKPGEAVWIVLDGPVDTLWIESLNSVLDDNKTLTLANGDRIVMHPTCKMIFEVASLENASPATVSRNGMIYMSSSVLDYSPILEAWTRDLAGSSGSCVRELFDESFAQLYQFVISKCSAKMELLEANYIRQAIDLFKGLMAEREEVSDAYLRRIYVFVILWSLGAALEQEDRITFITEFMKYKQPSFPEKVSPENVAAYLVGPDSEWVHWNTMVAEFTYPADSIPRFSSILVPTVDSVRTEYLVNLLAKQKKPVLLIGEQGTAKTVTIQGFLDKLSADTHLYKTLNFSSFTSPGIFQRTIESYVEKRVGTTYGPPGGRKMTVFIDDVNMPYINEWGDQITNEIVRQVVEYNGFYSLDRPGDFTNLADMQYIGAMIHPGGGRNDIPGRLKRHFAVFNCTLPTNESIDQVFGSILRGFFISERGFCDEVIDAVAKMPQLTRELWQATKVKMLPTPTKFHYVFNLRDLSRITEGMLRVENVGVNSAENIIALWKHECTRVIADRFNEEADGPWFEQALCDHAIPVFGDDFKACIEQESYYTNFMRDAPEVDEDDEDAPEPVRPRVYERVESLDVLNGRLAFWLEQYNQTLRGTKNSLVFFKDAMTHLVKISRIISTAGGHALLVGVGGSGKQSLTRLATFIAGYESFQITLSRTYGKNDLMDDLKALFLEAGVKNKGISFVFTDSEVKDEVFLEFMNNILTVGEVPGLLSKEEMDEVRNNIRPEMKKLGLPQGDPNEETEFFMNRVRKNLHIVLCFSPVGETFRRRALMFPGLISGCTCDWFLRWPKEALVQVAQQFVADFKIECSDETKMAVVRQMGFTHDDVAETCVSYFQRYRRQTYVTPKSFLSFVNTYKDVYSMKIAEIGQLAERMNQGLSKLIEASESVAVLKDELAIKEVDLAKASKDADAVLVDVEKSAQEAGKVKAVVEVVAKQAQELVESIGKSKAIAMKELEAAGPALAAAEAALSSIQAGHISTVRKLAKPPHLIMRIMDGVLLLLKRPLNKCEADPERPCVKPSWSEALKVMSQGTFLSMLLNFPKDEMNDEQMELLEPLLRMEDFSAERAKSVCGDVAGLCSWVMSMAVFYSVNKKVIPLKDNLAISEHRLQKAQTEYSGAAATLAEKQKQLDECQLLFDEAMRKKQLLLDDADTCRRKMSMASALISGLSGEKVRWTQQSKAFADQIGRLVGDVLMTCAFLSYAGPFNQEYRVMVLNRWKDQCKKNNISHSENLDLVNLLVHPTVVQEWHIQTLPKDSLSIQNGILVTKASRYPLLIDPQMQGKTWIKAKESENGLLVTTLKDKYFRIHLEDALSQGKPILIEDVEEELDPVLYPLLEKNFIRSGRSLKVRLGDKEVDVMDKFALYMTTKLANPRYTPEISAMAAIIDFTVTQKGLEDQLLGLVILNEKQELERELMKLMKEVSANNKKMKDLEDSLLFRLTSTKGSLVDDEGLVEMLATTKSTAEEVGEKLVVAADTEQKINIAREEYRPIATRGSILYFLIVEMSLVNFMYQVALTRFLQLFQRAMEEAEGSAIPSKRIENIIEKLTWNVFAYTVRGLYEKDKFLFTLMLALKIDLEKGVVSFAEFNCFIKGGASLDLNTVQKKPAVWIPDLSWLNLVQLSKLPQFNEILNQVSRNERGWKLWYDKDAPEDAQLQDGYQNKLSAFERLLLVRAWSADRTVASARTYIQSSLGLKFAEGVILNLETAWHESSESIPLIGFLSLGGDPTAAVEGLAKAKKVPIMTLSMGQGQEAPARRALQAMRAEGGWVLFQNCHLGIEFMEELLLQIIDKDAAPPHENFRLWLTTEVCSEFPISMLQQCLQYTNEPPNGYKAGLKRTYNWVTQEMLDVSNLPPWRPLVFATAFLHTTVLERRKFGSLGWNIPYEFNHSDLAATIQFMQNHLDDCDPRKGVSWPTIHYMISEVQYGGRVTDDFDQRMLNTYVDVWFGEHMFADDFKFAKNLPQYVIPKGTQLQEFRSAIEQLPLSDSPEVFGLHPNADITYSSNVAREALSTIVDIQPKESSGGGSGETREETVKRQADEFLEKLPKSFDPFEVKQNIRKQGGATPLNVCLRQEIDRIQRVITIVKETLVDLKLAIDGVIIMSAGLADALNCMFDGRVPSLWLNISWESTTLGFWFGDLVDRSLQLSDWLFSGKPNCFWLTGFFNPQGFLTSLRQTITRAHKGWSLDSVTLTTDVTKNFKEDVQGAPAEGLYIHGLFLEGAGWDRRNARLCESAPKVLFVPLPVVHVSATIQAQGKSSGMYECPVYTKPRRTDLCFVFTVDLRTQVPSSTWVVRGTALLCDIK